jgi:riboflavin kinase/FMN adenylyltransferase
MRILRHLESRDVHFRLPVATLGNFDGVHLGHQEILSRLVGQARSRGSESVVITFFPHPTAVLAPERAPAPLASLRERLAWIRDAGVDTVILQRFTRRFAGLRPEEFIERYLVHRLGVVKVIIGHSVNFGRGRRGGARTLEEAGPRYGFEVEIVGPVSVEGLAVSSTEVRSRLSAGEVGLAARLLGRAYAVEGRVVVGDRRGRTLGFPTANLRPRLPPLVPDGVYAVRTEREHPPREPHTGVANVGRTPTFGAGRQRTVEVHLFDFDADLYGERLRVSFVERLRGEMRFPSPEALAEQIRRDAECAREVLKS